MKRSLVGAVFFCLCTSVIASEAGPDFAREQRLADEIVDAVLDGVPEILRADGHGFLSIYTETDVAVPNGAVLLVHGRGLHPDWEDTIRPLRIGLVEHGWNTLSIQMPVLEKAARYFDYLPLFDAAVSRIEAAIAYLKELGNARVVVVAHSCGFHMVNHWLHVRGPVAASQFDAFVGIGMGATDYQQPMQEPFALDGIMTPVLDIYGEHDYPAVKRLATERMLLLDKAGNEKSRQIVVPGADHYFKDHGAALTEAVARWLATTL